MNRFRLSAVLVVVLANVLTQSPSLAAPIYKWEDQSGAIHYSTKASNKKAKAAALPPIMRGEVKPQEKKLVSCDKHGGINCQVGPDRDGSVLCYDGFREATARFKFSCTAPKLEVTEISDPDEKGLVRISIRNAKSVKAAAVKVTVAVANGQKVVMRGPKDIDAFGLGEYSATFDESIKSQSLAYGDVEVSCATCM